MAPNASPHVRVAPSALLGVGDASSRRIHGQGTPESSWRQWDALRQLPMVSLARLAPRGFTSELCSVNVRVRGKTSCPLQDMPKGFPALDSIQTGHSHFAFEPDLHRRLTTWHREIGF